MSWPSEDFQRRHELMLVRVASPQRFRSRLASADRPLSSMVWPSSRLEYPVREKGRPLKVAFGGAWPVPTDRPSMKG